MTPFLKKIVHAWKTTMARFSQEAGRPRETSQALKRKEMEAERIDRLRNPSNYQGR
jgi:hypothetical protein